MKKRHKRLAFIVGGLASLGVITALLLNAFNSNMVFFFSPSDVVAQKAPKTGHFRLGGLVGMDSLVREDDGLTVHFDVTDNAETLTITYKGILPDLFREGQGVVTQGAFNEAGTFVATEVLAKHDETYMPPEVAEALERAEKAKAAANNGGTI